MAENQRLRWWQEETSGHAGQSASERLAPSPAPMLPQEQEIVLPILPVLSVAVAEETDTWAELEAEAVRRAAKVEASKPVSFYTDKAAALTQYNQYQRLTVVGLSVQVLFCLMMTIVLARLLIAPFPFYYYLSPFTGFLVSNLAMIPTYLYLKRHSDWVQKSDKPAVQLSPQGIQICTPQYKNVMLAWNEVATVNRKGSGKYRRLELRSTNRRRFDVYEQSLGASVEALAAQIEAYKTARGIS